MLQRQLAQNFPFWASTATQNYGKYLGFYVGPEAMHRSWDAPLKKFHQTAKDWGAIGLGLRYSTAAYITYVMPILAFVAQLSNPPAEAFKIEQLALRAAVPGPFEWITKEDLFYLKECYGQCVSFPSLQLVVDSAQKRVYTYENHGYGGLLVRDKFMEIKELILREPLGRYARWNHWFENGPTQELWRNRLKLNDLGLHTNDIIEATSGAPREGEDRATRQRRTRKAFQKTTRKLLLDLATPYAECRMRHKLERWNLQGRPRVTTSRCLRALQVLRSSTQPRIGAAFLRTLWNGWPTKRRFQQYGPCLFCCDATIQEDSIEHYACCKVMADFRRRFLGLRPAPNTSPIANFVVLGLNMVRLSSDEIIRRGIANYAAYRAMTFLKNTHMDNKEDIIELMGQFAREGCRNHSSSSQIVESFFIQSPSSSPSIHQDLSDSLWDDAVQYSDI